ncbi:MAG: hypothetical protein MZV70_19380 [Desulfobacterales bacterium]|nr:hypothetical protein [Desulfobacterales bacterium]
MDNCSDEGRGGDVGTEFDEAGAGAEDKTKRTYRTWFYDYKCFLYNRICVIQGLQGDAGRDFAERVGEDGDVVGGDVGEIFVIPTAKMYFIPMEFFAQGAEMRVWFEGGDLDVVAEGSFGSPVRTGSAAEVKDGGDGEIDLPKGGRDGGVCRRHPGGGVGGGFKGRLDAIAAVLAVGKRDAAGGFGERGER